MIILSPALGIMIKINMPEVRKTIQQADITPYLVGCCVLPTAAAFVAGTNLYLKYGFVPPHRISSRL